MDDIIDVAARALLTAGALAVEFEGQRVKQRWDGYDHSVDSRIDSALLELRESLLIHQHQVDRRVRRGIAFIHVKDRMRVLYSVSKVAEDLIPAKAMPAIDQQIE